MKATRASMTDLDWIITKLQARREALVAYAPVFWRLAPDAAERHREFIGHLISSGTAKVYHTDQSVLVAWVREDSWVVDDFHVPHELWSVDAPALWNALASDCAEAPVDFVCPTYELDRSEFAQRAGLLVEHSWWLMEPGATGGKANLSVPIPGAEATIAAPPVYAPLGPVLYLHEVTDPAQAIPAAVETAPALGCGHRGQPRG